MREWALWAEVIDVGGCERAQLQLKLSRELQRTATATANWREIVCATAGTLGTPLTQCQLLDPNLATSTAWTAFTPSPPHPLTPSPMHACAQPGPHLWHPPDHLSPLRGANAGVDVCSSSFKLTLLRWPEFSRVF